MEGQYNSGIRKLGGGDKAVADLASLAMGKMRPVWDIASLNDEEQRIQVVAGDVGGSGCCS